MTPPQKEFTTFDIMKIFRFKRERLKDWMDRGFVTPSIQKASGQGTKNLFNIEDLYRLSLFWLLLLRGFSRGDANKIVKAIPAFAKAEKIEFENMKWIIIKHDALYATSDIDFDKLIEKNMARQSSISGVPVAEMLPFNPSALHITFIDKKSEKFTPDNESDMLVMINFSLLLKRIMFMIERAE